MPNLKKDNAYLTAENETLKALLKNALQLLQQSKEIIQHSGQPPVKSKRKRIAKKKAKTTAARGR